MEVLEPLRAALFDFADLVGGESKDASGDVLLTLLPFSETARVLVDRTPDPKEFKSAVSRLRPSGSTALIDAILSTVLKAFGEASVERVPAKTKVDDGGPIPSEFRRRPSTSGMPAAKRSKFLVVFTDAGQLAVDTRTNSARPMLSTVRSVRHRTDHAAPRDHARFDLHVRLSRCRA